MTAQIKYYYGENQILIKKKNPLFFLHLLVFYYKVKLCFYIYLFILVWTLDPFYYTCIPIITYYDGKITPELTCFQSGACVP